MGDVPDQEPLPQIQVKVDRQAAARFGINVADIATIIENQRETVGILSLSKSN